MNQNMDKGIKQDQKDKESTVTVRTPAGASHSFTFRSKERIDKVIREAVRYFVEAGQLGEGVYAIALVRDGTAVPLNEGGELKDYGIVDGDVLHLINKAPQVDG